MILFALAAPFGALAIAVGFLAWSIDLGRKLEQRAQAGDVDENGDIVDELRERLDGAIGPAIGDFERHEHLDFVLAELARLRGRPYFRGDQ